MGLVSSTTLSLAIIEERDDDVARIIRYNPHLLHRVVHAEKGFTPLQLALYLRREYLALVFIVAGADVNAPDMYKWTPLHRSIYHGLHEVSHELILRGADVNAHNSFGFCPLHWALGKDADATALALIEHGADVNILDEKGVSPLLKALRHGLAEAVELMVKTGADVHYTDNQGCSYLHHAQQLSDSRVMELLLLSGLDPNTLNHRQETALHLCVREGDGDSRLIALLLQHGADHKQLHPQWSAVNWAVRENRVKLLKRLVAEDVDLNASDKNGDLALHIAASRQDASIVEFLVGLGTINLNATDSSGLTAAEVALRSGSKEVYKLLNCTLGCG